MIAGYFCVQGYFADPASASGLALDLGIVKPAPISQMKAGNRPNGRRIPAIGKTRLSAESSQIAATIRPSHTSERGRHGHACQEKSQRYDVPRSACSEPEQLPSCQMAHRLYWPMKAIGKEV